MRLLYILILISCFSFSQTNEVLVNQAVQTAKSQNIKTKSQVVRALNARGITEYQARQIAKQRGLSYDQLVNEYFLEDNSINNSTSKDADTSILKNNTNSKNEEDLTGNYSEDGEVISTQKDTVNKNEYFGYNIFKNNPYLNKEYLLGNIDEGYLIAPGDEIRIITYGDNAFEQNVQVDRNGNINIKGYGLFFASGMTFKTLKSRLKIFLGKYLSGLVSNPEKTFMDVSLTQLRPVKVVVLGQVSAPGPHILNTSGSALSALYAAGGVKISGTLREIKIYRNNKLFKTIDLYEYITKGELKEDIRLTNNDIVFVDTRKNSILIEGEVYNSAFYELLEGEDLSKLIEYSGGLPVTAQTSKVNISRITPADKRNKEIIEDRELITFNYQETKELNKKTILFDGDKITFFPILDIELNQVTISGHVYEPGMYSLATYKNLKSLIFDAAKGTLPDVYLDKVNITSIIDGIEILNSYNLSDILSNKINVTLNDKDQVVIFSNQRVEGDKLVSISGNMVNNLTTSWKENFSLYDLIFLTTNIKDPVFLNELLKSRIDIKRYNLQTGDYNSIQFEFNDLEKLRNTFLLPKDQVMLYRNDIIENIEKKVGIYGEIKNGNVYNLEEEMYVEDLIIMSGGFQLPADQTIATVNRLELDASTERIVRKYSVEIDKDYLLGLTKSPKDRFVLEDNDVVLIKEKLGYTTPKRIIITGEVNFPQNQILEFKNTTFKDIINNAGGLTKYANLKYSQLYRNGKVITLDFSKLNENEYIFEDGDMINIASNKGIVSVTGAIENESNFIWKKGLRAKSYIKNSGGKIRKESGKSYVMLSNGKTKKINFLKNPIVFPNSAIIVNRKVKKEGKDTSEFLKDFNSTFGIIASTLMTILLASRL